MAALMMVMVMFFIMALVAAYTNRNLVFEQRTTANSYRAERALVAADSGLDWTLSMLNGGRIDLQCRPSTTATDVDFRRRYLSRAADGAYSMVGPYNNADELFPGCISLGANLTCICPVNGTAKPSPNAVLDWPMDGGGTAFRLRRQFPGGPSSRAGMIAADVRGCASTGSGSGSCVSDAREPSVDAIAEVRGTLGLLRALPTRPLAALTTGGTINATTSLLNIANGDAATGLSAHAGGAVSFLAGSQLLGPAGSTGNGLVANDGLLVPPTAAEQFTINDRFFRGTFGMDPVLYRKQPALRQVNCAAGCTTADLVAQLNNFPQRTAWMIGNLTIDAAPAGGVLGSDAEPVMVIVTGTLTIQAATQIVGFLYATDIQWSGAATTAMVRGALVAANNFSASTTATIKYEQEVLDTIRLSYGSFVRAPGSWGRPNLP